MFSQQDREYITEKLIEHAAVTGSPRQALVARFMGTPFPAELIEGGSVATLVNDAVRLCINDGWKHNPMWMQTLLDTFALCMIDGKINEIWKKSCIQPLPAADPLNSTILVTSIPFVNRNTLRNQLSRLQSPPGNLRPILVVNGDTKSGKSYSRNYIEHFSYIKSTITIYPLAMEAGKELDWGPKEVASDLVMMMGGSVTTIPQPNTNLKKYVSDLALWVFNQAVNSQDHQHWFILDNFNMSGLRADTRDLLIAMSDSVTKGIFTKKCRLILIGFDRAHLPVEPGKVDEEIIQDCTPADIDIAISEILSQSPLVNTPENINATSDFVRKSTPAGRDKMSTLNERLRIVLHLVTQTGIILNDIAGINPDEIFKQMLSDLETEENAMEELKKRLKLLEESIKEL